MNDILAPNAIVNADGVMEPFHGPPNKNEDYN